MIAFHVDIRVGINSFQKRAPRNGTAVSLSTS